MLKPWVQPLFLLLTAACFALAVFIYQTANITFSILALLASLFFLSQTSRFSKKTIRTDDAGGIQYNGEFIPYHSIKSIQVISQDRITTGGLMFNPLGNSNVYIIRTDEREHQILGKLYKEADSLFRQISDKSGVSILDR